MRQLYNRQKALQREYRKDKKKEVYENRLSEVEKKGETILQRAYEQYGTTPASVAFTVDGVLEEDDIEPDALIIEIKTETDKDTIQIERKKLLMQVLAAYGLLEMLSADDVQKLYHDIEAIFD
jgi:hypothetical protein